MVGYRQCVLHQEVEGGYREHVAYIPNDLAKEGKRLGIDGLPGWWRVVQVGQFRTDIEVRAIEQQERDGFPSGKGSETFE